jgi:AraC-like DNA-binding protein
MTSLVSAGLASSKTSTFTDPDLYRQAVRGVKAEVVIVGKGNFRGELSAIDFKQLWMQRGHESLARVAWIKTTATRASMTFATDTNQGAFSDNGLEVSPGEIILRSVGATYHTRTTAGIHWGGMSLTPEDLAATGRALIGRELAVPSTSRRLRPAPALMSRLLRLHATAGRLAKANPEILARPQVARALEQKLLHAMVRCLADGNAIEESSGERRHAATLTRLEDLLAANHDRPLYLAEICASIGVSERTLRMCCQEQLGMGPIQYLWLRRMNLAHRALASATLLATTVTEIATSYGFWELGRFAVAYRTLFGESPSETLALPPRDRRQQSGDPFALAI